jgi:hypothetical protein
MVAIWLFLKALSPRTWIIVGLVAVVGYTGFRLYHLGIEHEVVKANNANLEADKTEALKERDAYQAHMDAAERNEQAALATIAAQNARLTALDSRLASDRQRSTAAVAKVATLSDPQLFGDVTQRLGVRAPTDRTALFSASELREIDVRLAELPPLQDQLADLGTKVDALELRSTAQGQNISALEAQRSALFIYASQLHEHYAKAYALAQPHVSLFVRIVTLGLKKQKKLTLPAPAAIPVPAP